MSRLFAALLSGVLLSAVLALGPAEGPARAQDDPLGLGPEERVVDDGPSNIPQPIAVLRGLDKTTARVSQFQAKVGKPLNFGGIEVVVRACMARPPEESPESTAFLEVYERLKGGQKKKIFSGWMFASSPAINAVEHPVYDVWLIRCKAAAP